jgi:pimeloyl-ACP methyl ester carboxylesterase
MNKQNGLKTKRKKTGVSPLSGLGALAAAAAGAAGGWILYSNYAIDHALPLPKAIPADQISFTSSLAGRLNAYFDGSAGDQHAEKRPLVLIHSVNAAASAYEMRPLFQHYRLTRPVYALDLPGYGFSNRAARAYTPETFTAAILDLLATQVKAPADVIALSLSSEFAARAALVQPEAFHSLAMISPSGFNQYDTARASQRVAISGSSPGVHSLLSFPLWGRPLFDLIATRRSIEFFLKQSFVGQVPAELIDYAYATSHQPGAQIVPLYFISGALFTQDAVAQLYEKIAAPCLVLYDRDAFVRFDRLPGLLARRPNWQAKRISPSLGLPHFEKLPETIQALDGFWQSLENQNPSPQN